MGEIVNTLGVGPFEGYYRNEEAMRRTTRNGWYWSGDLGYVDDDGWVYFAGRTSDWLRVDGENFPAAPIEAIVARHPDVMMASVYGVPDAEAGDQVMVGSGAARRGQLRRPVLRRLARRTTRSQPQVATALRPPLRSAPHDPDQQGSRPAPSSTRSSVPTSSVDDPHLCSRARRGDSYRLFTAEDEASLGRAFESSGRSRAWDL